jgi:hypothetical protein
VAFYLCMEEDGRMVLRKTRRRSTIARVAGATWQEARSAVDAREFEHIPGHGYFHPGRNHTKDLRAAIREAMRVAPPSPAMAAYIANFAEPYDLAVPAVAIG